MLSTLLTLPQFIFVEIGSWLDLKDAVSFAQTCVAFRSLGYLRAFWVPILTRARIEKPLNWPSGHSLVQCTPDKLRTIAFHRLRLDTNWASPSPNISGPITSIDVEAQNLIAAVPATDIIIVHRLHDGILVCYDTETKQQTFQLDMPVNSYILDLSAPLQTLGRYTIAIRVRPPHSLVVICVDHMDGKATGFRKIFYTQLEPEEILVYHRPFLHGDYVGMISHARFDGNLKISVSSTKCNESVVIPTNLPPLLNGSHHVASFAFGSALYVMIENDIELQVYWCPCSLLSTCFGSSNNHTIVVFEHSCTNLLADSCPHEDSHRRGLTPPGTLTYGVAAISIYQRLCGTPSYSNTLIRFWPSSIVGSELNGNSRLVVGDAKGDDIHIPGRLRFGRGCCLGFLANSGTTVAVIADHERTSKISTYLVRYVAGVVSVHELIVPSFIPIAQVCNVLVDDYKGTVYLLDTYGILHCIPYA